MIETVLTCAGCGGQSADILEDPHAWDAWSFKDGEAHCPECTQAKEAK